MKIKLFKLVSVLMIALILITSAPLTENMCSDISSSFSLVAQAAKDKKKIRLKKSKVNVTVGFTYTQKLLGTNGKAIAGKKVKWKSANKKVATVSKTGKITAKKVGKAKITANYKGKQYTFTVRVKKPTVAYKTKSLAIGGSFTQSLKNTAGKKIKNSKITWTSDNIAVATVNAKGVIKAKKIGTATITAIYKGKKYKSTITVEDKFDGYVYFGLVHTGLMVIKGQSVTLETDYAPSYADITWTSNNPAVANVNSDGVVKGFKTGTAEITGTLTYGGKAYISSCNVLVVEKNETLAEAFSTPYYTESRNSVYVQCINDFCFNQLQVQRYSDNEERYYYENDEAYNFIVDKYVEYLLDTGLFELVETDNSVARYMAFDYTGDADVKPEHTLSFYEPGAPVYDLVIRAADFPNSTTHTLNVDCSSDLKFVDLGYRFNDTKISDAPSGKSTGVSLQRHGTVYKTSDNRFSASLGDTVVMRNDTKLNITPEVEITSDNNLAFKISYNLYGEEKMYRYSFSLDENNSNTLKEFRHLSGSSTYASSYEDKNVPFKYYDGGWKEVHYSAEDIADITLRVFYHNDHTLIYYLYIESGEYDNRSILEVFSVADIFGIKDDELAKKRAEEKKKFEEEKKKEEQQQNSSSGGSSGSSSGGSWGGSSNERTRCIRCNGTGSRSCTVCGGDGWKTDYVSTPNYSGFGGGSSTVNKRCPSATCNGGRVTCSSCGGDGWR